MTFNDFKNWLKSEGPVTIRTLGGRSKIKISLNDESKVICVNSPGTEYPISQETFERTMKQYNDLKKDGLNTVTVQYTDTNWNACPNRNLCPYIAAAIASIKKNHPFPDGR